MLISTSYNTDTAYKYNINSKVTTNQVNNDHWINIATGIGVSNSRLESTKYIPDIILNRELLSCLYKSDGIAKRIVNIVVDDSLRTYINCDNNLKKELDRVKAKQNIIDGATWGRLYGGSVLVAFIDDGQEMDKKLNYKSIRKLISLKTYDRYQLSWTSDKLVTDYYSEFYGEPEVYTITPYFGQSFDVHRSRMFMFTGDRIPNIDKINNSFWDSSVLQSVYYAIRNYAISLNASAEIVQDFIQVVIGINDLTGILSRPDGEKAVIDRAKCHDATRSICKSTFIDSDHETYEKKASSVAGLEGLLEKYLENICAITGIPITKFGKSASGLNSTGKNDSDNWDNVIESYRSDQIAPAFDFVIDILKAQLLWKSSDRPLSYEWDFPSLKPLDELQQAQIRLITAQADALYIDRGIPCNFVYTKRHEDDGFFKNDIHITEQELKKLNVEESEENPEEDEILSELNEELNRSSSGNNVNNDEYVKLIEVRESEKSDEITTYVNKMLHKKIASKINE